jgi:hypothetical protein
MVCIALTNRGCQKSVPLHKLFLLQLHMPPILIPEHKYEKRYKQDHQQNKSVKSRIEESKA